MPGPALTFGVFMNDRQASRAMDKMADKSERTGKRIGHSFGKLAGTITGAFAGVAVVDLLKDSVGAASDLNESISKTRAVFGPAAKSVESFASTASVKLGQSQQAALEASATFGNLFRALGIGEKPAADLSKSLVTLAGDLASFNNVSPDEALLALRSGLLGEAEPLRKFGVSLSAARIEAEGLSLGLVKPTVNMDKLRIAQARASLAQRKLTEATKKHGKTSKEAQAASIAYDSATQNVKKALQGQKVELTAAQKAQAAYSIIMKDTALAQGDFSRTSDGLANQQRILSAQFTDVKAKLGTQLLPVVVDLAKFANTTLVPAIDHFVTGMQDGTGAGGKFADIVGDLGGAAKDAWHVAEPFFSFVGDHPKLFSQVAVDAAALALAFKGIGAVKKLPGLGTLLGGGAAGGGLLGGITKAAPLPVFVTNALPGGGGGLPVPGVPGESKTKPKTTTDRISRRIPTGVKGAALATAPTAVLLADVELVPRAVDSLGKVFNLRFDMSVNDAAKKFREKLEDPSTDAVTRKVLQRHYDAVFAGVAEAARTGGTKPLQDALNATYVDLAKNAGAITKQIARENADATADAVRLISGGFLTVADLAKDTGKQVAARLGGGVSDAKDRVDSLNASLAGFKQPIKEGVNRAADFSRGMGAAKDRVDAVRSKLMGLKPPIDDSTRETQELLTTLGYVSRSNPRVNISGIDPAVQKANELFRQLERIDGTTVSSTVRIRVLPSGDYKVPGGTQLKGSAGGNYLQAFEPSWVGERGREIFQPDVPGRVLSHQDSMRAVQGTSQSPITNHFNITTADPVRAAHEALRMQRDRMFVESL